MSWPLDPNQQYNQGRRPFYGPTAYPFNPLQPPPYTVIHPLNTPPLYPNKLNQPPPTEIPVQMMVNFANPNPGTTDPRYYGTTNAPFFVPPGINPPREFGKVQTNEVAQVFEPEKKESNDPVALDRSLTFPRMNQNINELKPISWENADLERANTAPHFKWEHRPPSPVDSEQVRVKLGALFDKFDKNKDGVLDIAEVYQVACEAADMLKRPRPTYIETVRLFTSSDENDDQVISRTEYANFIENLINNGGTGLLTNKPQKVQCICQKFASCISFSAVSWQKYVQKYKGLFLEVTVRMMYKTMELKVINTSCAL
eukprot:TRINITY_DN12599_c0_g1_i2.p1 TRINITY_DN12599_c0_g1~~TRINITY_DN12599_c0_g1_i2.p1  ORF type:complete len:314 (+),score=-5.91 TRINITY_DN12599_c0_g1_i2:182-1123(+)